MTFKLRIRGRDHFDIPTAANPANPLISDEQEVEMLDFDFGAVTANDLQLHTISRLAGLAGRAIEKAVPYVLSEADRKLAEAYHQHHFGCRTCCAAGQDRVSRCEVGLKLWTLYLHGQDGTESAECLQTSEKAERNQE